MAQIRWHLDKHGVPSWNLYPNNYTRRSISKIKIKKVSFYKRGIAPFDIRAKVQVDMSDRWEVKNTEWEDVEVIQVSSKQSRVKIEGPKTATFMEELAKIFK